MGMYVWVRGDLSRSVCVCRWWAGQWEACSATCGPHGEKTRTVLCIQTTGSDEQALPAKDCQHLLGPKTLLPCNRDILCPSDWTVGNWSEVSSGVKGKPALFMPLQPLPFRVINQSKVTLEEMAPWPAPVTSGLFPASSTAQNSILLFPVLTGSSSDFFQWSDTCLHGLTH